MSDRIVSVGIKDLGNIADDFGASVAEFDKKVDALFESLNAEIGVDESHGTWHGARAGDFMKHTINPKKTQFKNAVVTLNNFANKLSADVQSWNKFENSSI